MTLPLSISLGLLVLAILALLILWFRGDNYDDDPTGDGMR